MYIGSWDIDDVLTFSCNTHSASTGAATDADSAPTYRVYEDETSTPILTGTAALLDSSNTAGLYSEQITLSAANGFERGKSYTIYISATVGGVTGTTPRFFQVGAKVNTTHAAGTAWASGAITAASIASDAITASKVADGAIDAATFAAGAINAAAIAADAGAEIADAVWDEVQSGHTTAGTFGKYLDAAVSGVSTGGVSASDIADAVWDEALSGHTTSGTAGERLGRVPNVAAGASGGLVIAGSNAATTFATLTSTGVFTINGTSHVAQTGDSYARIGAPAGASVSADVAAVKGDTASLLSRLGAFAGSGVNTVLGFFKALLSKTASTPSDVGGTFDPATDSVEAVRDRGDSAWVTATGFSTHSAADVWAAGTRTLTAATNITSTGGTITVSSGSVSVYDFTTAAKALINAEADTALADVGVTTTVTGRIDRAVSAVFTTAMTESYAADAAAPTPAQSLFLIQQMLTDFTISGTTMTVRKVDGSTSAFTLTLDDGTSPTGITRTT